MKTQKSNNKSNNKLDLPGQHIKGELDLQNYNNIKILNCHVNNITKLIKP